MQAFLEYTSLWAVVFKLVMCHKQQSWKECNIWSVFAAKAVTWMMTLEMMPSLCVPLRTIKSKCLSLFP